MKKMLILGAGAMGSAMTVPSEKQFDEIILVGTHLDDDIIQEMQKKQNFHPKHAFHLPSKVKPVLFSEILPEHFQNVDLVILGVSSKGVNWAVDILIRYLANSAPILILTKGMKSTKETLLCFPEIVRVALRKQGFKNEIAAVGGPCIALELVEKQPTGVVITATSNPLLSELKEALQTEFYRIKTSNDLIGVEVCAAFKNFYAITVGTALTHFKPVVISKQRSTAYNAAAFTYNQALKEIEILVKWLGGKSETVYDLACLGDLYVTVAAGRNSRLGRYLGQNKLYQNIIENELKGQTVEGADLAKEINHIVQKNFQLKILKSDQLPLMNALLKTVCENQPFSYNWDLM